ncbi:thioredoxin family protein [Telmatospirillum sp.]|uniref:thioredoxin family protein n=1 Tax=Telmatospirillum sp. TaxID=2079197 RepID=UPI00283DAD72|nr:thioredoxin family protein [Telmatospirillum sp.]MDR3436463.1 thioredoxin family protein [Telmatospirillum sp.]
MRKLYKFSAPWCQPCKQLSPKIDQLLPQFPDIDLVEVNIDNDPHLANDMGVKTVPTLILDGRPLVGNQPVSTLRLFLEGKAYD